MIGFNSRKRVCIIAKDYQLIRKFIIEDMHRGATLYPIKGGLDLIEFLIIYLGTIVV